MCKRKLLLVSSIFLPIATATAVVLWMQQRRAVALRDDPIFDQIRKVVGIEPVPEVRDPKTGFLVGGRNSTDLLRTLTEINGRSIADLERDMRPGALSTAGFLGQDESLIEVLVEDNRYVVDELGLTHQELAWHLRLLGYLPNKESGFLYKGRRFRSEYVGYLGSQQSPFEDGTETNNETTIYNLDNGKEMWFSMLVPDMIERYGFYEGKGTKYRVDPREIVEVLDFLKDGQQAR